MSTARDPLLSPDQKLSPVDNIPVLIEIKEPRIHDALAVLDKVEGLLAKKAPHAICVRKCEVGWAGCLGLSSLPMIILGGWMVDASRKDADQFDPVIAIIILATGVACFLLASIGGWYSAKEKIPADAFSSLTADEEKDMTDYLQTVTTVGQSLGVATISVEGGLWTKDNSATLFANARDIKKSLSERADLLAKRESTEKGILSSIPSIEQNLAAIMADYAVCPRPRQ